MPKPESSAPQQPQATDCNTLETLPPAVYDITVEATGFLSGKS